MSCPANDLGLKRIHHVEYLLNTLKPLQVGRCGADHYTHVTAGSMFDLGRPEGP